ncbi:MAG: ATP-binding protein [Spartobacteria bacterium]|nr:ATP-binding protein [Spartobacteria bacterium]
MVNQMTLIKQILELNELALKDAVRYPRRRDLFGVLQREKGRHFMGISGPRGVGKTVMMKQLLMTTKNALYLSLDTLPQDIDLFELIKELHQAYQYSVFFLDEVHFHRSIHVELKKIYDFLNIRLFFSSSMALAMAHSAYDLSRRALVYHLFPFSLREYLSFKHGVELDPLTFRQVEQKAWSSAHMRAGIHFEAFIRGGLMPFALCEPDVLSIQRNILETVIMKDIPTACRLHIDELDKIRKLIAFIGRSGIDGINYTTLSKNIGITKYKAEQYVSLLEKAFVLQQVFPKGTNVLKEPKVLMAVPYRLLYHDYDACVGGLREDFFAESMRRCHIPFFYLKSIRGSKTPDYLLDDGGLGNTVIEIGGKGKGREQFKGLTVESKLIFTHSDLCDDIRRPLFMLGYLSAKKQEN